MTTIDRPTRIAMELMKLGVSNAGITELLTYHSHDAVEKQLAYLPYRKAKRPEAFIIDAVRNDYSPPKEYFYAQAEIESADTPGALDENTKLPGGQVDARPEGHRTADSPGASSADCGMAAGGKGCRLELPNADEANRTQL